VAWTDVTPVAVGHLLLIGLTVAIATTYQEHLLHRLRLQREAHLDPLTLTMNRRGGVHHLDRMRVPYALLVLDLDAFKHVNDHHGHAMGDTVLVRCAKAFRAVLRPEDLLVRWGGDEFVVITNMTAVEDVDHLVGRLRRAMRRVAVELDVSVDVSIGTALGRPDVSWQQTLSEADAMMYRRKIEGRKGRRRRRGRPSLGEPAD